MEQQLSSLISMHASHAMLLIGDMNAALLGSDRNTVHLTAADRSHQSFVSTHGFAGLAGERHHTFITKKADSRASSRIDDILVRPAPTSHQEAHYGSYTQVLQGGSDHLALVGDINLQALRVRLPYKVQDRSQGRAHKRVLALPILAKDQERVKRCAQADAALQLIKLDLSDKIKPALPILRAHLSEVQAKDGRLPGQRLEMINGSEAQAWVNDAGKIVKRMLERMHALVMLNCRTRLLTPNGKRYLPRKLSNQRQTHTEIHTACTMAINRISNNIPVPDLDSYIPHSLMSRLPVLPGEPAAALETLCNHRAQARTVVHAFDTQRNKAMQESKKMRQQKAMATRPKKANKEIFGKDTKIHGMPAITDGTNRVLVDPHAVVHEAGRQFAAAAKAPRNIKTGDYSTSSNTRFPWVAEGMVLTTGATTLPRIPWLHSSCADQAQFMRILRTLPQGRAPGPDNIPNEVLRLLPTDCALLIHDLFTIMWATGCTPDDWKISKTTYIYKNKGDPAQLSSYRPITMANTIYKLWTAVINTCLQDFVEAHKILSDCQNGFRKRASTQQALREMAMTLQDAQQSQQDCYLMLVDLTNAFNTVNHDTLLRIMKALGVPCDVIEVVKGLYTGAATKIEVNGKSTPPIPVNRGTLQGDTLSPLLFNLYVEPLLRWMHYSGQGYMPKCVAHANDPTLAVAAIAYADDLAVLTRSVTGLRAQARRLTEFCNWADLTVSAGKTLVTGTPWRTGKTPKHKHWTAKAIDQASQSHLCPAGSCTITAQGHALQFLPPSRPFTYLGVRMTMTNDWGHQHRHMTATLKEKCQQLQASMLSPRQIANTVKTVILPSLAYSFPVVPCSAAVIARWDATWASTIKKAYGLWRSAPTAMVHAAEAEGGLGYPSLAAEYHTRNTQSLMACIHAEGTRLAVLTSNLLHAEAHSQWHAEQRAMGSP
jgi:hypothetical protein